MGHGLGWITEAMFLPSTAAGAQPGDVKVPLTLSAGLPPGIPLPPDLGDLDVDLTMHAPLLGATYEF